MKKVNYFILTITLALFAGFGPGLNAQEFPWPDLGDAMIIEPGAPGTINETIHGDTTATGERNHYHYILRRGQTYLYTARINNVDFPLMVTAEDTDGDLPIIKALGPAAGEDEAERIFHAQGDLYLKDLILNGWDQQDGYTDNATIRLAKDSITVVAKDVVFDFNRQNNLRINAAACSVFIENSIIANQGVAARLWQGFFIAMRGNYYEVAHFRNNTIYNMHHSVATSGSPAIYNKLIFENNTVVNTGTGYFDIGRPDTLIFKNNLYVNAGILGDAIVGDRENFEEPFYFMSVDSNYTDTTNTAIIDPSHFVFTNNHFYLNPDIAALLPDSSDKSTDTPFNPYLQDLMGSNNMVKDEAFAFTNFPVVIAEYEAYINDFYGFSDDPAEMPQFTTDFSTFDFSYPTTHPAYTAGTGGKPLGDLNWFGMEGPLGVEDFRSVAFKVYPNPVNDVLRISDMQNVKRVEIINVVGQRVREINNISDSNVELNVSDLDNGIYIINFHNGAKSLGYTKFIKK